jgi:hypothetical protein
VLVIAAKLYSDQGVPLPRHREITLRYTGIGVFSMSEGYEKDFRRTVRVANLRPIDGGRDCVLPPLYDAAIVWVGDGQLRVRGFEINPMTMAHVAMVWGAEILADQRPGRVLVPFDGDAATAVITSQADLEKAAAARTGPPHWKR